MSYRLGRPFVRRRALPLALAVSSSVAAMLAVVNHAWAQDASGAQALPDVEVIQKQASPPTQSAARKTKSRAASGASSETSKKKVASTPGTQEEPAAASVSISTSQAEGGSATGNPADRKGSLGVPATPEARAEISRTPGAVSLVANESYKGSTPATTIKDVLDYVPGVIVQPKWGEDTRLSIRGSGLSRNFHLRGLQLYMDGIPINTADGFGDFQEIDPTAYRYVEVYKGANALRFGANALGGAVNFVMPTGYDADKFGARADVGSFGLHKLSASSGGVAGAADYFITGTWQEQEGFRDHSWGDSMRGSLNLGYRLSENVETRFYVNANSVDQRIPGSVTKSVALNTPETAAAINVTNDWQRNIDTVRLANKTTVRLAPGTTVEVGAFYVDRHLMHPIYLWLDYQYDDYGGFARLYDESTIAGHRNRLVSGVNLHNGETDSRLFGIGAHAVKGPLFVHSLDRSKNASFYAEDSFYLTHALAVVGGVQYLHAERESEALKGAISGSNSFDLWSPKIGLLYDLTASAQIFANISRSAEVPSFGENKQIGASAFNAQAQRATTYEIGTRGRTRDYTWEMAFYRANLDNELMCVAPFPVADFCVVANADETVHQGVEIGGSAAIVRGLFETTGAQDELWINAAYTYSDFHFDNDAIYRNNALPGAPAHFVRAELLYKHPGGIYFGPNVEWVPEAYYADSANTLETKAYAIWGLKFGYDAGGPWSAYIEGRNLSDTAYIASTGITNVADPAKSNLFEPGTGRAVYGGVQVRW